MKAILNNCFPDFSDPENPLEYKEKGKERDI